MGIKDLLDKEEKKIKVINKIPIIKEVKEKPCFKQDYLQIQKILEQESFYASSLRFDYDDYKIDNETVQFAQFYKGLNTPPKEVKYYDSPVLDNHKVDDILNKFKFAQMKGQVLGDDFIPEDVKPDDFERFYYFKKLNPALIILKYALNPL